MLRLPDDEIHLWFAYAADFPDPEPAVRPLLSPAEAARMARLIRPGPRRLFALSRLLVRTTLSRYFPVSPEEWRFSGNPFGKPLLDSPHDALPVRFSLAHTSGLAVFALARGADVGVDAERTDRAIDACGLSRRFFSPEEAARLLEMPPERSSQAFFSLWTLKESFLKALGRGFSLPMSGSTFRLSDERPSRISLSGGAQARGEGWRYLLIRPPGSSLVAVSASFPGPAAFRAVCRKLLPSGEAADLPWEQAGLSEGVLRHP